MISKKIFQLFIPTNLPKRINPYLFHVSKLKKFPLIPKLNYSSYINNDQNTSPNYRYRNPYHSNGEIQVIYGPMFSGKTSELIRRIRRYTSAKRKCIIIKYNKDNRYDDERISTHDR